MQTEMINQSLVKDFIVYAKTDRFAHKIAHFKSGFKDVYLVSLKDNIIDAMAMREKKTTYQTRLSQLKTKAARKRY